MVEDTHCVTRTLFDVVLLGHTLHAYSQLEVASKRGLSPLP